MDESHKADWNSLPDTVLTTVLSLLSTGDKLRISKVCQRWLAAVNCSRTWRRFMITFDDPKADEKLLDNISEYIQYVQFANISVVQGSVHNRRNTCRLLETLAHDALLISFKIGFAGQNPLFYGGKDILSKIMTVFEGQGHIKHVDLSALPISFHNDVIDALSLNSPRLEHLNIANDATVCRVESDSMLRLVRRCKHLIDLHIHHYHFSEDVIKELAGPERKSVENISVHCSSEQKILKAITSESWFKLLLKSPDLKVVLSFDHTCPVEKLLEIMQPNIPIHELYLETYTPLSAEINMAATCYSQTLEKVVLQTPTSHGLTDALIDLCKLCKCLKVLVVYCVLDKTLVDRILNLCPTMKRNGTYVLRSTLDPWPWLMKCDEKQT